MIIRGPFIQNRTLVWSKGSSISFNLYYMIKNYYNPILTLLRLSLLFNNFFYLIVLLYNSILDNISTTNFFQIKNLFLFELLLSLLREQSRNKISKEIKIVQRAKTSERAIEKRIPILINI